ncbi:hypothetical protein JCM19235_2458 [Vibrio maritimus]|uniref:Uncharacterized protein n=1 Tax=Vibrio maritimus TaxID=990268 RepID=A0A090RUE3_9VIBR|nr:hypothetical protein JCM19235_2458 [Vibrio maritimus]
MSVLVDIVPVMKNQHMLQTGTSSFLQLFHTFVKLTQA